MELSHVTNQNQTIAQLSNITTEEYSAHTPRTIQQVNKQLWWKPMSREIHLPRKGIIETMQRQITTQGTRSHHKNSSQKSTSNGEMMTTRRRAGTRLRNQGQHLSNRTSHWFFSLRGHSNHAAFLAQMSKAETTASYISHKRSNVWNHETIVKWQKQEYYFGITLK